MTRQREVKALQNIKEEERNERKRAAQEMKERRKNAKLLEALRQRNLNLYLADEEDDTTEERDTRLLESLKCSSHNHVSLNEENQLVWPVRLLYPEHATSDLIQQCSEVHCLSDHLSYMFPPKGESSEWDSDGEYTLSKLCVIYDSGKEKVE